MKTRLRYFHYTLIYWFIFTSNASLANDHPSIFQLTNGLSHTQIPFRFVNNMIILPISLNGQEKLNFILDTGTRTPIVLNKKTVKKLELPRGRNVSFSGAGTRGVVKGFVMNNIRMNLTGVEAKGISMVVLEKNYLKVNKLNGIEIHGILGATLFRSFVVNIDYFNQIIHLIDKKTFLPCSSYASIPMKIVDSKPIVEAELLIENTVQRVNLMIDTGFNYDLLLKSGSYTLPAHAYHTQLGQGFGGLINGKIGKIHYVKLEQVKLEQVMALFPTAKSYPSEEGNMYYHGTIGNRLLKPYNIVLDYAGEKFYIKHSLIPSETQEEPNPLMALEKLCEMI